MSKRDMVIAGILTALALAALIIGKSEGGLR